MRDDRGALLAVFAHPDDESSVGPLLAKYAAAGHPVDLVSLTSGQKGYKNTHLRGAELAAARERELCCAATKLGIGEPWLLRFEDQELSTPAVMREAAMRLRDVIAQTRPDIVITFGPDGLTGHPDHRAAGNLATEVFQQQTQLAFHPKKLYYVAWPESCLREPVLPFDGRSIPIVSDVFITTVVDCRDYLDRAHAAIQCHRTQWDAGWMEHIREMGRSVMGGRVYLRLALSTLAPVAVRETDVFAGLNGS